MRDDELLHIQIEEAQVTWDNQHGGNMWLYEQNTGRLLKHHGEYVATGYSGGNGGEHPEGINNHEMQSVKNVGPIPLGHYTFGEVVLKSHLGPYAIPLLPDSDNQMFGRSAFYIHGDRADPPQSASDGCIILPRAIRELVYSSNDRILRVVLAAI